MRDPDRIDKILDELRSFWLQTPGHRVAHITTKASNYNGYGDDPFHMEDYEFLKYINKSDPVKVDFNRDKKEIEDIIEKLETYWKNNYDLRFGQIISNAGAYNGYNKDCWVMEDNELLSYIEN